jgi:dehydratase
MRRPLRTAGLSILAGGFALATIVAVSGTADAAAVPVPVNLDCQAKPPIGAPQQMAMKSTVDAEAPATVAAATDYETTFAPEPILVPADASGNKVNNLHNLKLIVGVPAGATYKNATITGGSNLGTGIPSVAQANGLVTVTVPGPLAGGSTITLPVLHLTLTSGATGTVITTKLAGSSYTDPGMAFIANVQSVIGALDVPANCFGNPNPTLTTTTVS